MTASASWRGATPRVCGSTPAEATISPRDFRSSWRPSRRPVRSCSIDGEAIVSDDSGLAVFNLIRSRRQDHAAVLCAFDLIELDGEDLRGLCRSRTARHGSPAVPVASAIYRSSRAMRAAGRHDRSSLH
jgi:hypothetical protein